jgi:hypothetical protein
MELPRGLFMPTPIRNMIKLHIRDQLYGFGYYLVLLIPAVVIIMIMLSVPEERYTEIPIFAEGAPAKVSKFIEELRNKGYDARLFKGGLPEYISQRNQSPAFYMEISPDGRTLWDTTAPHIRDHVAATIHSSQLKKETQFSLDLLKQMNIPYPNVTLYVTSAMPFLGKQEHVTGIACVIGTWFISSVITILVHLEMFKGLTRLRLVYTPTQILLSTLIAGSFLSIPPMIVMLATGIALGCWFGPLNSLGVFMTCAILSGAGAGMLIANIGRAFNKGSHEVVFFCFMLVSQGFIVLAQYSGILTSLPCMTPVGRNIAKFLPLSFAVRLFDLLAASGHPLMNTACLTQLMLNSIYLIVFILLSRLCFNGLVKKGK